MARVLYADVANKSTETKETRTIETPPHPQQVFKHSASFKKKKNSFLSLGRVSYIVLAMPGSQLSQLKSAVSHTDGLSKKRKRLSEEPNPFDLQVSKTRHDVGGRNVKGRTGKPALKRQAGIEQVCATLLLLSSSIL